MVHEQSIQYIHTTDPVSVVLGTIASLRYAMARPEYDGRK